MMDSEAGRRASEASEKLQLVSVPPSPNATRSFSLAVTHIRSCESQFGSTPYCARVSARHPCIVTEAGPREKTF